MSGVVYLAPEPPSQNAYNLVAAHALRLQHERDEWQACAELLAELAQHPREGDEFIGDYVELRARAMGAFRRLKEGGK